MHFLSKILSLGHGVLLTWMVRGQLNVFLILEMKSEKYIDAEENIHDRKTSTSFLRWENGTVLGRQL